MDPRSVYIPTRLSNVRVLEWCLRRCLRFGSCSVFHGGPAAGVFDGPFSSLNSAKRALSLSRCTESAGGPDGFLYALFKVAFP